MSFLSPTKVGVPVHEYWLEHRRAMLAELAQQREEMLSFVAAQQRSAFFGLELLEDKLRRDIAQLRTDSKAILKALEEKETAGWRAIVKERQQLAKLQQELDQEMMDRMTSMKELFLKREEQETYLAQRAQELQEWSAQLQQQMIIQESELSAKARSVERDMSFLIQAKHKELPMVNPHINNFAKIYSKEKDVPRVVVGQALTLSFVVRPHKELIGMPAILTYLEGRDGSVNGHIVAVVDTFGNITFQNVILQGKPGTSHVLLVSIPRTACGTVEALEVPVHFMAMPEVRATGFWVMQKRKLMGRLKVAGVDTFGLLGTTVTIMMQLCGQTFTTTSKATETNEFPFEFNLGGTKIKWEDIIENKAVIEAQVPVTKYTTAFFHRFDVRPHSEVFPTFQYPTKAPGIAGSGNDNCGIGLAVLPVPYTELVTECAVSGSGRLLATTDVAGTVSIFSTDGEKWVAPPKVISHSSFISKISWSSEGGLVALLEPKERTVHVWKLSDVAQIDPRQPHTLRPSLQFKGIPSTTLMTIIENTIPELVVVSEGKILATNGVSAMREVLPATSTPVTCLFSFLHPAHGQLLIVGYANASIVLLSYASGMTVFAGKIETKDSVVDIQLADQDNVLIATSTSVSVLASKPTWGLVTSSFRTPSTISSICLAFPESTLPIRALIVHTDGNICVLDVDSDRVLGYGVLQGLTSPMSSVHCVPYSENEFRIAACTAMKPVSFGILLVGNPDANRKTRDAVFSASGVDYTSGLVEVQ